jgi:hypothetical protein
MRLFYLVLLHLFLIWPLKAQSQSQPDYFKFNSILDNPPTDMIRKRLYDPKLLRQGLQIGAYVGAYFGEVKSYLDERESTLLQGRRPLFGMYMGYRFGDLELSFNLALGLGTTYKSTIERQTIDFHFKPSLQYILIEKEKNMVAVGLGVQNSVFSYRSGNVSQYGIGPALNLAYDRLWDERSRFFVDFSFAYVFDPFAYYYRQPTADELSKNPDLEEFKVSGGWYYNFFVHVGYRLRGF